MSMNVSGLHPRGYDNNTISHSSYGQSDVHYSQDYSLHSLKITNEHLDRSRA
jgi:chromosome segregation ATPase